MDKNKNRTDLLAAGRKKLQQFRQKKDGKVGSSQGKSSKKSSKSEQHESDVDAASASEKPTVLSLLVDSDLRVVDSSSKENSVVPEIDVAAVDPSSAPITPESGRVETSLAHDAELPTQELGAGDAAFLVPNEVERTQNVDGEEERATSSATIGIPILDGETKDANMSAVASEKPTVSSLLVDSDLRVVDSSSKENSVVPEIDVVAVDPSSVPIIPESGRVETSLAHDAELPTQELGAGDDAFLVPNEGERTQNVDGEEERATSSATIGSPILDGETKDANMSAVADLSISSTLNDTAKAGIVTVEMDNANRKLRPESTPPQEVVPATSLIQEKGYQVTDVGAMQEADGSGFKQYNGSNEPGIEEDEKSISPELGDSAATIEESASGATAVYETTHEENRKSKVEETTVSTGAANMSDGSASAALDLHEAGGILAVSHQVTNQLTDKVAGLPNEEKSYMLPNSLYKGVKTDLENLMVAEVGYQQNKPEGSLMVEGKTQDRSIEKEITSSPVVTVSTLGDGCSISLSQLKEIVRGLGEDEFKSLLNSRGSVSDAELGTDNLILPKYGAQDSFERLKEELYFTNFMKDIFHLQLMEMSDLQIEFDHLHHQSVDEVSLLRASLNEAQVKRECLAEELAHCKSELHAVASRREELESQVHSVKAEAQEFSARAHESQISLERSLRDLSSLSVELADCKGLVASLQVENENLSGALASEIEDRRKLVEEKESSIHENEKLSLELADCRSLTAALQVENSNLGQTLALLTQEKKMLEEEKESLVGENEKMSMELTDFKDLMAAQRDENAELNGSLALVTEERNKLEAEKKSLAVENGKMSFDLTNCKSLVAALQGETAELNGSLALVTEMRKKLEEERESLAFEIEKISVELADCKGLAAALQGENANLNESLALSIEERKKLEWDKDFFVQENERLCNELLVSQKKFARENGVCMQDDGISSPMLEKPSADGPGGGPSIELQELVDDSSVLAALKGHLEEAEKVWQNLEKAIEQMHSESMSFNRSGGKLPSPGVSRLIQAFESKVQHDEPETEDKGVTEDPSLADLFMLTKEQMEKLRAVLQQLYLDAENAKEELRKISNVTVRKLKVEYEALNEHCSNLEVTNIELGVLYEAVRQHAHKVEAKNDELQNLFEDLKQDLTLKAEYLEASEKASEYQSRISILLTQLRDLQQSSDEKTSILECQVESLQKESFDRMLILEHEWKSTITQIVKTVERLDEYNGRVSTLAVATNDDDGSDVLSRIAASVNSTIKVIENLQGKLETAYADNERVCSSHKEVNERFNDLVKKNESASVMLHTIYRDLKKLVIESCGSIDDEPQKNIEVGVLSDPIDYVKYKTIFKELEKFLSERLQLQSLNNELKSELISRTNDIDEFNRRCLDSNGIQKLIEEVESVVKLENPETDSDKAPLSHLESLVSTLIQRSREAAEQASSSREEFGSLLMELTELQEMTYQLSALNLQHETEIIVLKESLMQAEEALVDARSELQEKVGELELLDQRVSSIREKLSIAVSKGKGLVVQRDSLKQSLAETSNELERCSQELQLRDTRLYEVETKLKTYMEAGERVEALESELSYIRNSATALRESFLLKDSVLQRIEEILEDLDLPEQFHSRDIIEKVDWLARSATSNFLPVTDWDQKSSVGGSYSDAGFVVMDAWKEDAPPSSSSGDDMRRKYEELQSKFYGLAEQNEMLEQSLMERNHLVQRWEELLDRINMPAHLRSMEPEDRIEWLGTALMDTNHDRNSLQQKIESLEDYCRSVAADLEESQKRIYELEADIQDVIHEREHLSEKVEIQIRDHEKILMQVVQFELEKEKLQSEMTGLQEQLERKGGIEERIHSIEGEISRLEDLVSDALQDSDAQELVSGENSTECLEILLRKLIEQYSTLSVTKAVLGDGVDEQHTEGADASLDELRSRDVLISEEPDVAGLKKDLEDALLNLMHVKEERDAYMEKQQSLIGEVAALDKKREELQELLTQEEQKSTSLREKLNVAVRKGKSLVQQRDSLKQTLEEMTKELDRLKSEISHRENALADREQKLRDLSTYPEMVEALESERSFLRSHLMEAEHVLQEREHMLNVIMKALGGIDVGAEVSTSDPVEKLKQIGKQFHDLHAALASSELETRKSRRAADLLLAELNEVQERNDVLQEELEKAATELSEVYKERDEAEAAKVEALSHLERLSTVFSEGKHKQYSELIMLKSGVTELKKGFLDINILLADVFSKDLELLHNLEAYVEPHLKQGDANDVVSLPILSAYGGNSREKENFLLVDSWSGAKMPDHIDDSFLSEVCNSVGSIMQELKNSISSLREKLQKQPKLLHDKASSVFKLIEILCGEMTSQKKSFEALKRDITRMESIEKEKDSNIFVLLRNIAVLYEACVSSIMEIENRKAELVGNNVVAGDLGMNLNPATIIDGGLPFGGQLSSEEFIKSIADKLFLTLKDFAITKTEVVEDKLKEMKITIANMQRELQEKDIQKDRICTELVSQIKEAEAAARNYSLDLQLAQTQVHDMEQQMKVMEEQRSLLEKRLKELQDEQVTLTESKEKVRSLSNVLAAKDQEIEALMQALDEEEIQMEEMKNKLDELEKVVQQKNLDLENLEASRGKIAKRLSVTVSKFDELHHLSETLLSEVEKLQSQLQDRDSEISFLRQEVTRCTNDVLIASQMGSKRDLNEIQELLSWFDTMTSQVGVQDVHLDSKKSSQLHECKEVLKKKISAIISEVEDLRVVAQSRDALLEVERNKVQELSCREEILQNSLCEKELQINMLEGVGDSGRATSLNSEILEVEPLVNKWTAPGASTTSQVRSLRKVNNNDQVAIAIDMEPGGNSGRLEDEDDDKVHGFKSLTTSRIVPKFTRPATDMVDGLWVSCDRALMRQPALRLGIIVYWAVLHTLLASFVF